MYNSYCFTVGCILLGISVLFIVSVLHMCSIYVPYGCSICPVAQPDAGYATGHPVIQPDARLRHLRSLSAQPPGCATGRDGLNLPGCSTEQVCIYPVAQQPRQ